MYIGIYGGTFNPIHLGHLRTAEEVLERFEMKQVIFVPAADPPHKDRKEIIDPLHRLKMATLAVTGNPRFTVSDIEIHREGKSYSIDTVRELKSKNPEDRFAFILGMDAFLEIHTWHKFEELFKECDFIVTTRPGSPKVPPFRSIPESVRSSFKKERGQPAYRNDSGMRIIFTEVTPLDISGTAIRAMTKKGLSIRYLLPRRVMEYIQEHGLYK